MELVAALGIKSTASGKGQAWGLFFCPFCKTNVERWVSDGKRNRSCGCHRTPGTHGLTRGGKRDPLFEVWNGIKSRCGNPNHSSYARYGGRGITVCEEWLADPNLFYAWALSNGWKQGMEVDRRENDGSYCPGNCRVVTHVVNCRNRASSKLTASDVLEMRMRYAEGGITKKALGVQYGVTDATAGKIINNKIWIFKEATS
jgi:hypothetical protein